MGKNKRSKRIIRVEILVTLIAIIAIMFTVIIVSKIANKYNIELLAELSTSKANYKTDAEIEWGNVVGGDLDDQITCITETKDRGYLVGGYFYSNSIDLGNGVMLNNHNSITTSDGMIIKYDEEGNIKWGKAVGGEYTDRITCITETRDGGCLVGGYFQAATIDLGNGVVLTNKSSSTMYSDGMIIKYGTDGKVEWGKAVGGNSLDQITCITETQDGGYAIGGYFSSSSIDLGNGVVLSHNNGNDGMIIKYGANGEVEWGKVVGGSGNDQITCIAETTEGGYLVGGNFYSSSINLGNGVVLNNHARNTTDGMIIKYDKEGSVEWGKVVGESSEDYITCVTETRDAGYVVGGYFKSATIDLGNGVVINNDSSSTNFYDGMIIKYGANGKVEWGKVVGGEWQELITCITETQDGGYAIGGYFESSSIDLGNGVVLNNHVSGYDISDGMIIKYDKESNVEWGKAIGGRGVDQIACIIETKDGGYAVGGGFYNGSIDLGNGKVLNNHSRYNYDGLIIKLQEIKDRIPPTITVSPTSGAYAKSRSVTITVEDEGDSELSNSNSYQYYLSTSSTALSGGAWTNYTSGTAMTIGTGKTGEYYLFIKRVEDNEENISESAGTLITIGNVEYHRFGPYKFDNTKPTAGTLTMKLGSSTGTAYTNNTWTNQSVYIAPVNGSDGQSGHKTTTYSVSGGKTLTNQTVATTLTETGTYTVTVTTTDNVGNTATNTYTIKIDKTKPTAGMLAMKLGSSTGSAYTNNTWTNQSVYIAPINGTDGQSGHKTTTYSVSGGKTLTNQTVATTLTETGTYTVTVTTTDNVGNTATSSAYTIKIDKTKPTAGTLTMKLGNNTGSAYTNNAWTNQSIYIEPVNGSDGQSGHKTTTYSVSGGKTLTNQTKATTLTETGTYTVTVTTTDNVGNTATSSAYTIKINKTAPTITVNPASGTVAKSKNVTITVAEAGGAGLNSSNSYQYYVSTSSTALEGGAWTNYTSGTAFTIGAGKTGTFYLFVKRVGDNAGNITTTGGTATTISGTTYQRFGTYIFDNSIPTVEFTVNGSTEYKKAQSTIVTITDVGEAGIKNSTLKYQWNQSTTEPADNTFSSTFINGGKIEKAGITGADWYLWILAEDNLGNKAKVRTNEFYFDNAKPNITKNELINNIVKIEANDKDNNQVERSGVYKYRYITSNTKQENPEITKENSTEVEATGEIRIPNIDKIKYIYIQVEDKAGNISTIVEISVPTLKAQGEVNLLAGNGKGGVNLSWELGGQGERTYKIYQKSKNENEWKQIQTTEETSLTADTSNDIAVPNAPQIQIEGISEDNKINISQTATDNGSTYRFYVEAYDKTDTSIKLSTSEEIEKEVKTGVKGYYYILGESKEEWNTEKATYIEGSTKKIDLAENGKTLKMKAVDVGGNIGEETRIEIKIPSKVRINPNGGTLDGSSETKEIEGLVGKTIEIGTPIREGYTFIGWEATAGTVEGTQYTYAKEEGEVTARWQINEYTYQIEYYYEGIKNNEETITQKANYESVIREYEDKVKEGYRLEKTESLPLTITTKEENNIIKIYYVKRSDLTYIVNYIDEDTDEVIHKQKIAENQVYEQVIESNDEIIEIRGYEYSYCDKERITIEVEDEKNIITIYYYKRSDLHYTINYLEKGTKEAIKEAKVVGNQVYGSIITTRRMIIEIEGFNYDSIDKDKLTIQGDETQNVVNIYYIRRKDLKYTVNYLEKGTNKILYEQKVEENQEYDKLITLTEEAIEIEGYTYDSSDKENMRIQVDETKNIMNIYYTKRQDLSYTVNYLKEGTNNKIKETKVVENQTFESEITAESEKIDIIGYKYVRSDKESLTITTNEENNVINMYYEIDGEQTKELRYTVEYYKNGKIEEEDTQTEIRTVQILEPNTIKVDKTKINIKNKYIAYELDEEQTGEIPETVETGAIIKVYYTHNENKTGYKIEYYYDGKCDTTKTEEIEVRKGETITKEDIEEKIEKNKTEGYRIFTVLNTPLKAEESIENIDKNIIKVHYITEEPVDPENPDAEIERKTGYKIEYYYDNKKDNIKTEVVEAKRGEIITKQTLQEKAENNKEEGYKFVTILNEPLEISTNVDNNVIKIHYVKNEVNIVAPEDPDAVDKTQEIKTAYSVEYYYDNQKDNRLTDLEIVKLGTTITKEDIEEKIEKNTKEGYKFAKVLNEPLEAKEEIENNVIKVYYVNNEENIIDPERPDEVDPDKEIKTIYTIEYYYDNKKDNTKTELEVVKLGTKITKETINDRVQQNTKEGYKLAIIQNIPLEAKEDINNNVIKIHYKTETEEPVDPNEEEVGYIIEYYYNGTRNNTLTEIKEAKINSVITEETIQEQVEKNKSEDYISVTVLNTPLTISKEIEDNVIKVYYVVTPKETDHKKYKIEYYYDNEKDDEKTEEINDIKGNVITEKTIGEKIKNNEEDGYKLSKIENTPLVIEENEEKNIIKIYYIKRTDLSYRVEYYYEGEKEEDKTENIENQTYKAEISTYTDKVKEGYKLEKTENLPLTITAEEERNIIKIYYVKRNDLSYKVNYLEKGTNNKIKETKVVENQIFENAITTAREIVEIDGYNYNSIDKENITITVNDNEINIYYTKREDLSYTVNYVEKDTNKVLRAQKVENNQVFGTAITAESEVIEIEGYEYNISDKESITIGTEPSKNVINLYYTRREDLSYEVKYLEKGTNNKIKETKVVENQIFESIITTTGEIIEIDGYNYNSIDKESLTITANQNEINIYYTKREDLSYTVNYLEEDTDEILHAPKVENDQEFEKVVTAESEVIEIEGYEYNSSDKENIKIGTDEEQNVITIYYIKRSDLKYTVNYLEEGTNEVIKEQKIAEGQVFEGIITASTEIIEIDGYNYVHSDKENITIQVDEKQNEINLYYTKRTDIKYKVEYYYGGEKDEEETEEYTATYKEIIEEYEDKVREGYMLVEVKGSPLEIQTKEEQNIIKVYYAKITQVTVKYLNKVTNEVIEEKTEEGYVGKEFVTEAKDFKNYILVEEPEEKTIIMEEEEIIVRYYYIYVSKGVIEKHIDVDSGEILYNAKHEGNEGDEYKTEPKEFEHYEFVEERYPENAEGKMEKKVITVSYYYKKIEPITITVKYIDQETNEEIEEKVEITDYEGEEYKTEQKEIEGYEFVEVVGETEGVMTEEKEIIYYYQKVKQPEPEIPGEGGDDPSTNKPSIDEEQKQPQTPDQTTTNKEIPSAGLTKEQIAIIVVTVMVAITGILVITGIKGIKLDKKY